jgi:DNA helicase-2/ATP-dependent DNA helicase PcrA
MAKILKVFGPPGTGKTTFLLSTVEQELAKGIPSNQIGYFSFTRKAANEARDRAIIKFPVLNERTDFPYFRTLHSLAFRQLNISSKDMMQAENFGEFAKKAGIQVSVSREDEDICVSADNPILNEINLARITGTDLRTHYNRSNNLRIEWFHLEYVQRVYNQYKQDNLLLDFTDLLERIVEEPFRLPVLETVIIDEAQDLSRLQWKVVEELAKRCKRVYIAGDDDQALFTWAGADVDSFLSLNGEVKILDQSFRIPSSVHVLANDVVHRIQNRQPKVWAPRDYEGRIYYYNDFQDVDVSEGNWLILASTNYMLNDIYPWLKAQGLLFERNGNRSISDSITNAVLAWEHLRRGDSISAEQVRLTYKYLGADCVARGFRNLTGLDMERRYDLTSLTKDHGLLTQEIWHKALIKFSEDQREYLIAMLRRGIKITAKPKIRLSTIHGAKGGEADNVLLLTDLSPKFAKSYGVDSDAVNRMFYVGITRAKETLHLVRPANCAQGFFL